MRSQFIFVILFLTSLPLQILMFEPLTFDEISKMLAGNIKKFLAQQTIGLDVRIAYENPKQGWRLKDILDGVLHRLGVSMTISICNVLDSRHSTFILVDSEISFRRVLRSTDCSQSDYPGYFLVYFDGKYNVEPIFKALFERHIINVYVIMRNIGNGFLFFTHFPFLPGNCFNYKPNLVCLDLDGVPRNGHNKDCIVYPEKLSNFYGCELIANTLNIPPYLFIHNDSKGVSSVDGIEGYILKLLAQKLNFTIAFKPLGMNFSHSKKSLTTMGVANFSVGRLRPITHRRQDVISSVSYFKSDIVLVIRSRRSIYSVERLLSPVSANVWLSYGLILVVAYNIIRLIKRRSLAARNFVFGVRNHNPTYWLWVIAFGGPAEYKPRRNFARFILIQWISWNFFVRAAYQCFVFKSFRMNWKTSTANSFDEILANGYTFVTNLGTYNSLSGVSQLAGLIHILNGSEVNVLEYLEENYGQVAAIVPIEIFQYYQQKTVHTNLSIIKDPLIEQVICMHFRRNSYFKIAFDRVLTSLQDSGLLMNWKRTYLHFIDTTEGLSNLPRKLTFGDAVGIFQVYVFLIKICFVCLGIELLSLKVRFLRRMMI